MDIVLATRNEGKVKEFMEMLPGMGLNILSLKDFPRIGNIIEDGSTFEANAIIKAREVSSITGLTAIADDSGLEVDALDRRPGVYSARYAGDGASDEENYLKLLDEMRGVPEGKRGAAFVCAIAVCTPSGETLTVKGKCQGEIAFGPDGDRGFGYDPVFFLPDSGCTMAGLPGEAKNAISHRGKAVRQLAKDLPSFLAGINK